MIYLFFLYYLKRRRGRRRGGIPLALSKQVCVKLKAQMYKHNCCKLDERHSCIVFEMSVNVLPFQPLLSPSASDNQQPRHMTSYAVPILSD